MGVETAIGIGAGASALGGAVSGAKGTPDQVSTTQANITPAGAKEQALQQQSLANYNQANQLAGQVEQNIQGTQGFQDQARQAGQNILSGQAMQLTPQEQQQIADLRSSLINQGQFDINAQTTRGIGNAQMDAANRGLRGQAMGALQGQVLQAGTEALGRVSMDANRQAAQAAMSMPYQRIGAQQGLISQGLSLADQLRQQAVQNRMSLQDPALMGYLSRERIAGATQQTTTPGQGGGFWQGVAGGLAGAGQGANIGANVYGAINKLNTLEKK
jgi:hypothetical protein